MDYALRTFSVRACATLVNSTKLTKRLTAHARTHSRFHTRFYVSFLPSLHASGLSSFSSGGVTQHRLPTPDGGQEVVEARFVHPQEALSEHRSKKIAFMPPQHYILTTLAELLVGREMTHEQRERVEQLSAGAFGRMVVCPQVGKRDANGRTSLVYESDEARGGPRGRLHRSIVRFSPETKVGWLVVRLVLLNDTDGCDTRSFLQKSSCCETLIFSLKSREVQPLGRRQSYDLTYLRKWGFIQVCVLFYIVGADGSHASYWMLSVRLFWIPAPEYIPVSRVRPTPPLMAPPVAP
jgi:hypothetical protein